LKVVHIVDVDAQALAFFDHA